jgi:hypothetical protein
LLVHATTAATVGKFAIDYDRWNGSNAQFFGAHKDTTVRHIAHDDFTGRTRFTPHQRNRVVADAQPPLKTSILRFVTI